jgi:hypothetical protein
MSGSNLHRHPHGCEGAKEGCRRRAEVNQEWAELVSSEEIRFVRGHPRNGKHICASKVKSEDRTKSGKNATWTSTPPPHLRTATPPTLRPYGLFLI